MLGICILVTVMRPYNYELFNLYQVVINLMYIGIILIFAIPVPKTIQMISSIVIIFGLAGVAFGLKIRYKKSIFATMLSFPKSHKIEGLLRFQLWNLEEKEKAKYVSEIKHRLSILKTTPQKSFFDQTMVNLEHENEGNKNFLEITKFNTEPDYKGTET